MTIRTALRVADTISEWTGRLFAWLVVPITIIVVYEVISRRLLNAPHIWSFEVSTFLYSLHFMMVAAYTLLYDGHVTVDLIYGVLSRRWQAVIDVLSYLLFFFPFFLVFLVAGTEYASDSWATSERTMTAQLPLMLPIMKTLIPVASFLLLLQGASRFVRSLYLAVSGREL
jgi:TRAP-type mannitol/chloroaromatic compound transport system permease small subunit